MKIEQLIPLSHLCQHYNVEMTFFTQLNEFGLIEIQTVETTLYVHQDTTKTLDKIIVMHHELEINFEGIDTILHLLSKIDTLQNELVETQNKLRLYED